MEDFEKLGAFYLGKRYDLEASNLTDELVLYDSKDLNTHAVIIGMTGSGKTGLGIGLIEEAAIDHVPVIAIDPKGDLGNLMLTFPQLAASDFEPWVDPREATRKGLDMAAYAQAQANLWEKGLGDWGQSKARIAKLKAAADITLYTPGSSAGVPVSALQAFRAPDPDLIDADPDLYRDSVQATATGILALLGIESDPLTSREHILLSRVLDYEWREGRDLDLAGLIARIQSPPFDRIGVMDLDGFYPQKARFELAMRLNNLLAAPGFEAWLKGEPLDAAKLLHTADGKPRVSIMSIAHLADSERMFFVTLLLNEIIRWMRTQPGTGSLRAILYMDELFGYMPPVANPPTKALFLTLLKQARAYGLGLVLSTQNPVDLDYKGLSNTGTWFIGRLQTERDKARVMEGLEGAAAGGDFDRGRMQEVLAGLGKRRFLLHNVHETEDVVFNTRWVMSYLAGPLTRGQIKRLVPQATAATTTAAAVSAAKVPAGEGLSVTPPVLGPGLASLYLPANSGDGDQLVYQARLLVAATTSFHQARLNIDEERDWTFTCELDAGPGGLNFDAAEDIGIVLDDLDSDAEADSQFLPAGSISHAELIKAKTRFKRWLRTEHPLRLWKSTTLKAVSQPGETEGDFRVRLQQLGNERRDKAVEKLRAKFAGKTRTLEDRIMRARQAVEREGQQASKRKLDTAISIGSAILGAVLGRRITRTSASKIGTAAKGYGGIRKEAGDVARAKQRVAALEADLLALSQDFDAQVEDLDSAYDAQADELKEQAVRAKSADIDVRFIGVGFVPYWRDQDTGILTCAWEV
jgi:hypothetical protein